MYVFHLHIHVHLFSSPLSLTSHPHLSLTSPLPSPHFPHSPPPSLIELNLVDILYQMLRDKDVQVVSNCISALNEILASEGGMVMNAKIAHYLLNR